MLGEGGHPGQARHRPPCTAPDCPVPARAGRRAGRGRGGRRSHQQEQQELPLVDHVVAKGGMGVHIFPDILTTSVPH